MSQERSVIFCDGGFLLIRVPSHFQFILYSIGADGFTLMLTSAGAVGFLEDL